MRGSGAVPAQEEHRASFMCASGPTDGELQVKLEGNTPVEQQLQDIIDGTTNAPAGPCRVISPDVLAEAIKLIRSLRSQVHDK
jgi:hypothetical protein